MTTRFHQSAAAPSAFSALSSPTFELGGTFPEVLLSNTSASAAVEVSFDGSTVHGVLTPDIDPAQIFREVQRVWIRETGGSGATVNCTGDKVG